MLNNQFDLRLWLLQNVADISYLEEFYKLLLYFFFLAFIFLSLSPILLERIRKNNIIKRLSLSDLIFSVSLVTFIVVSRWPGFLAPALNPDEACFIAGGMKLLREPVFWRAVDTGSSGPLNIYPVALPAMLGLRLEYASARIVGLVMMIISVLCLYYSLREIYDKTIARLSIMPVVTCIALMTYFDYIHYSGEHVSVCILSIALLMLCRYYSRDAGKNNGLIFCLGFTIGLIPYAKLQAVPVALTLFCIFSHILWVKKSSKDQFLRRFCFFLFSAMLFSILITVYLIIFSLQDAFWLGYIKQNIVYSKSFFSFSKEFNWLLLMIYNLRDSAALFGLATIALLSGLPFLIGRHGCLLSEKRKFDTFIFVYYCLAFLGVSIYSVIYTTRHFPHYLLFLIIPSGFLIGIFLGELRQVLQIHERNRQSQSVSFIGCIVLIIVLSTCQQWYRTMKGINIYLTYRKAFLKDYISPIARTILNYASPGETMAIWGWIPGLYVDTGLIQAARDGVTYWQIYPSPEQPYYLKRFADDILSHQPGIFVDAVAPGAFGFNNREKEGHENFPEVASIVKEHYKLADEVNGTRIYVKKNEKKTDTKENINE
jgi:hypothetical protein